MQFIRNLSVSWYWFLFIGLFSTSFACSQVSSNASKQSPVKSSVRRPAFTNEMLTRYVEVFEFLLELKITGLQKERLRNGLSGYWRDNNAEGIQQTLENLEYTGKRAELESLRITSQQAIVRSLRNNRTDSVAVVLVEAYDSAHPDHITATQSPGFSDLVGIWKRADGLLAEKTPGGEPLGVSYTNSATLKIFADGRFIHTRVNNRCRTNCCQLDGTTEYGVLMLKDAKMVFAIQSGDELIEDDCNPLLNARLKISPREDSFSWSITPNPGNNNKPALCWSNSQVVAVCYDRQ